MTKQEKTHTIELTEHELARVLFVIGRVNGEIHGESVTYLALEKLNLNQLSVSALNSKRDSLARSANLPVLIDYYRIQKEWETFLGIGISEKNKDILDKIAYMEKELAELKGML